MRTVLIEVPSGAERDPYLPLLRLADSSEAEIRRYYMTGDLYGLVDPESGSVCGELLVVAAGADIAEIKSVAIDEAHQGKGLGRRMIDEVLARLRARGIHRVIVGTSSASVGELAFYQKLGFRLLRVERDYFIAAKGYDPLCHEDGIPVRDMVWLDRCL